jgi:hypothetical protein
MKRSDLELWFKLGHYGEPKGEARFSLLVKGSLISIELLKRGSNGLSKGGQESIRWHYANCIKAITEASRAHDGDFFRTLADGYDALKKNDPLTKRNPASFLTEAYFACVKDWSYLNLNKPRKKLPTQGEVVAKAKRLCALVRLTGSMPTDPSAQYEPKFETKIAAEIEKLPETKWSREFKKYGLDPLPSARPGPKKRSR